MKSFRYRFELLLKLAEQELRTTELAFQELGGKILALHETLRRTQEEMDELARGWSARPLAMPAGAAVLHASFRDKIVKVRQITRARIAEVERERDRLRALLEAARQRVEQLRSLRAQDLGRWRIEHAREEHRNRLDTILRDHVM